MARESTAPAKQRRQPHLDGSKLSRNAKGEYKADFRWLGRSIVLLRDPRAEGWTPDGKTGEPTTSEAVARVWERSYVVAWQTAKVHMQLGIPAADGGRLGTPLARAVEEYLAERDGEGALSTYLNIQTHLRTVLRWYSDATPVGSIAKDDVQRRLRGMLRDGYAFNSARNIAATLSGFLSHFGSDAGKGLKLQSREAKDNTQRKEALTDAQIDLCRAAADEMDRSARRIFPARLALELALATGVREGELWAVRWEDFRGAPEHTVHIAEQFNRKEKRFTTTKSKKARTALVLPSWWDFHREGATGRVVCGPGGEVGRDKARMLLSTILERAGVKRDNEGAHILRHTYARLGLEMGMDLFDMRDSLGHHSVTLTEKHYAHFSPALRRRASEKVYGVQPQIRRIA